MLNDFDYMEKALERLEPFHALPQQEQIYLLKEIVQKILTDAMQRDDRTFASQQVDAL